VFLNIKDAIQFKLLKYLDRNETCNEEILKIKLSADATNIGRFNKIINFTFTIINETSKAKSAAGNYTLGIINCETNEESYEKLQLWVPHVMEHIKNLKSIRKDNKEFQIHYYFGSDWMMMAEICGLYGPSSNFPCIWCICSAKNLHFLAEDQKRQNLTDEHIARHIKHLGYKRASLLTEIPFNYCILDTLHLFLRISETLLLDFFYIMCQTDNVRGDISVRDNFPTISSYFRFLKDVCKITVQPKYKIKHGKLWLHRNLTGPEKIRLFQNIDFINTFPSIEMKKRIKLQLLWKDFFCIFKYIKRGYQNPDMIQKMTARWLDYFTDIAESVKVTPYIHVFCNHVHEFIQEHGNINTFNEEGLEKLNDISTLQYFRSTNKWVKEKNFILQLLLKRSRISYLEAILE